MSDAMGTFRVTVEIENPLRPGERCVIESALVDTGAALSWFPGAMLESLKIERIKVLNLRVDPVAMRLVDSGPAPAAAAA